MLRNVNLRTSRNSYVTKFIRHGIIHHETHTSRNSYVTCTDTGEYRMPSLATSDGGTGKNGTSWQWRMGRTARLVLRNVRVLRSRVQNAADGLRHWEREVKVQYKLRGQDENKRSAKEESKLWSLHKSGINYAHFMFDSTVVVLELHGLPAGTMRTYTLARRGARHHAHA